MVNKVTFVGFRRAVASIAPSWIRPCPDLSNIRAYVQRNVPIKDTAVRKHWGKSLKIT